MRLRAFAGLLPLLLALALPIHARPCELSSADREWIGAAIEIWGNATDALERSIDSMPWTVLYDEHCAVHLSPRSGRARADDAALSVTFGGKPVPVRSRAYRQRFSIPSGAKLTSGAVAFTSLAKDGGTFFVMALPSVWRKDPRSMPGDIDEFASGVLAHEMTHTIHLSPVMAALEEVKRSHPSMPESIDDDYLQSIFEDDTGYVAAYEREIALYQRAVAEPDSAAARESAREALAASDRRRERHFQGDRAFFAEVEPLFLNMEGVASWVAYAVVGHGGDPLAVRGTVLVPAAGSPALPAARPVRPGLEGARLRGRGARPVRHAARRDPVTSRSAPPAGAAWYLRFGPPWGTVPAQPAVGDAS